MQGLLSCVGLSYPLGAPVSSGVPSSPQPIGSIIPEQVFIIIIVYCYGPYETYLQKDIAILLARLCPTNGGTLRRELLHLTEWSER